ncbi:FKS1 [Symbiodinium natans]|uniref:1,3-beta-glucan synthase n=1 Tax=Symbiodinium natans TaxID=878477 RepID=A0A812QZH4_9DINO|nr:FKS1 [Symbiodinium natans]
MVADRDVQEEEEVQEDRLLTSALEELHTELLQGFRRWRSTCEDSDDFDIPERREGTMPPLAGARWTQLPASIYGGRSDYALEASRQLAEITAYLLVWGESGNVRFMPEVVYFLTEMVLGAEAPGPAGLYGGGGRPAAGSSFQSRSFLAKVVRPIYNVVFDEWYEKVDKNGSKDKKILHKGYEAFLPPDVANYDDWNELFCDPTRLAATMVCQDGELFCEIDHGQRFANLHRVAWEWTLDRFETKTHREVHSLWGFLASTHRVWLVHMLLFAVGLTLTIADPPHIDFGHVALLGNTFPVRLAAVGLVVPLHAILWGFARYETTGATVCRRINSPSCWFAGIGRTLLWASPLVTYAALRYVELKGEKLSESKDLQLGMVLSAHSVLSALGLVAHLFFPDRTYDILFPRTPVHLCLLVVRYTFWFFVLAIKFLVSFTIFASVYHLMHRDLRIIMLGQQSVTEMKFSWSSVDWGKDVLEWALLWFTTFFLFCADTGMWFTLGCTFLGVGTYFAQRSCEIGTFCLEDAVAKIPERMSEKVFCFVKKHVQGREMAREFPLVWDRILEYMRYEDKIGNQFMADQSFMTKFDSRGIEWSSLSKAIQPALPGAGAGDGSSQLRIVIPNLFKEQSVIQRACQAFVPHAHWPANAEVQWRLLALSRGLGLPIPKPFRAPYIPGITVLIPHYGETILEQKESLYGGRADDTVPLMDWLKARYEDEWLNFDARMQAKPDVHLPHGANWDEYTDEQWEKICGWSSMRLQTLWRTVAGMMLYHPALQCHYEVQGVGRIVGERKPALAQVWTPNDCFSCIVSMQQYANFEPVRYQHTNQMFAKFPSSLKVAYIDQKDKNVHAEVDNVHPRQHRRYFSCLIDGSCADIGGGRRAARYTVELPGYPILGDGKSDNQNHAIIFLRGIFSQCIDANQGGYFEQMLMLPCVLGEFRTAYIGDDAAKQIIGLPEHITSDIGSVGDFAAGSEVAFGTILQRTYAVLGARMHYGHPDIMNKQFMIQQGGVSKATKTINLSEDIFAGMDFTLRGQGRSIKHCEYFHVAKGRDLGFNTVLGFFSKLSSGAGEQILTRQMFRLGQILHLPEALTFYYAHVGYYITQGLVSASMPILVFAWMVVLAGDCETTFKVFENYCPTVPAAQAMANLLSVWYSWVIFLFLVATSMPLFAESWMERSFGHAVWRLGKQYLTLSFLMFVFQAKIIGYYVVNELRYGGAQYVATGRGLPTYRRPFIGEIEPGTTKLTKVGGLYLDYAVYTYYDGMRLLASCIVVLLLGGVSDAGGQASSLGFTWLAIGITIVSWLYGPFVFNPYQFDLGEVRNDVRAWIGFFLEDQGKLWVENYQKTQLKPLKGFRESVIGVTFLISIFCLAIWFAILTHKLQLLEVIYSAYTSVGTTSILTLLPPVGLSLLYCLVVSVLEAILGCPRVVVPPAPPRRTRATDLEGASSSSESDSEEAGAMGRATLAEAGVPVHAAMLDTVVDRPLESDDEAERGCKLPEAVPLAFSALMVTAIEVVESLLPLYVAFDPLKGSGAGWSKTFVSGLVLKYLLYEIVLFVSEGVLRSRCYDRVGSFLQFLSLWVHANRMFRDMFVSSFILLTLSPLVLVDTINGMLCEECSLHNLLVYRDPGHLAKEAFALHYTAEESDSAEDREDGLASGRRASRSASRTLGAMWSGMRGARTPSVPPTTTYR